MAEIEGELSALCCLPHRTAAGAGKPAGAGRAQAVLSCSGKGKSDQHRTQQAEPHPAQDDSDIPAESIPGAENDHRIDDRCGHQKGNGGSRGTPFRTRLRNTGTEAQSHTGRQKPAKAANKRPPARCFGKCSWSHCCETNIWMAEDRSTPIRRNGNACNRIPRNTLTTASAKFPRHLSPCAGSDMPL